MKLIYMAENIPLPRFKPKEKKEGILLPRSKPKEKKVAGTDKLYSMMGRPSPEDVIIRGRGEAGLTEEARRVYESSRKSGQHHTKPLPEEEGGFFDPLVSFFTGDSEEDVRPVTEEELYGASLEEQKLGLPFAPRKTTEISRKVRKALIKDAGKFPLVALGLDPRRLVTVPEYHYQGQHIPHKDDPKSSSEDHLNKGERNLLKETGDRPYLSTENDFLVAKQDSLIRRTIYHEGMHKGISDLLASTDYKLPLVELASKDSIKIITKSDTDTVPFSKHSTEEILVRLMIYRDLIPLIEPLQQSIDSKNLYQSYFENKYSKYIINGKRVRLDIDKLLEDPKINAELDKLNSMAQKLREEKGHSSGETFKNFQSGGLNMARTEEEVYDDTEDQMDMMGFEPQEQSIAPVSGNEVPLGGTAEGVRDDIDVKMSKGEMVIPEYAVNYHGVETYINSIQKAQRGYEQMQDMGLVGNPDEAVIDQGEPLPKMEENDTLEFQAGGYVDGVNTIPRTHGGESLAYISPEEASYLREIGGGVPTNNPSGQITKFGIPSFEAPNWVTNQAYKLPGSRMHYVYQQALAARRDPSSAHYRQPATKLGIQGQHGGSVAPAPVAQAESVPVSPSAAPQTPYVSPSARRFRPRLSEQDRTIRTAPLQSFSNLAPANFGGLASAPLPTIPTPTISPPVTEDISTVDGPLRPVSTQPTPTLSPYPSGYFIEIEGQPNMFKFVAPPGQQNTLTGTYTREQVGNAPIAPAGTTPESVYGPQFQTYAPSYTLQNVPSTGGYEVIPYTNAEGDTIYMTSVNGQIQGTVPQGYSPSVEEDGLAPQMEQPVQAPVVSEKPFVPPGGYPTGPLGGGVGVTPPSVTPTTVSPALSAENQATVQSIQNAMKSQGILGGDVVSEADIVSQTAPHAAINVPLADTPLGNISTLDVVSAAVKVATKLAGFPSVVGQAAIGIPMALAFHKNQTATAQMQAKLGIEGAAFDPVTGWSFHKTESLFGKLALVAYNKFDVTSLRNASDVMRTDLAMRFNADFTGMTNTEIYKAQRKDENGVLIGYDAPKGQINNSKTGMHLSDGTFYSHRFKTISDSSSLGDFQALSPEIQARNWAIRNSKWYRTNPIMTDAAKTIHNKNVSFVKDMYPTLVEDSSEFKNMVASVAKNPSASKQISFSKAAVKRQANLSGTKRRSSTPGFGGTTGKAKGKSTGTGAFCWVARKVYGEDNPKWQIFRSWLCTQAPKWLYKAYGKYGESFAEWLDGKERTQKIIRKWMDKRIQKYLDTQPKTAQEIGPL